MLLSFGYIDSATKLGNYCRGCLLRDDEKSHSPEVQNNTWEIYKCMRLTDELIDIFDEIEVFNELSQRGYRFREEPTLIRWTYTGENRGAADHYHHDGHYGKGGQVSLMLLLESNVGKTHMRIIPDSRESFGRKIYDFLWRVPFRGRGRLFRFNDWLLEHLKTSIRLEGPKDRLYIFNAGDNLHKAFPIKNTTRTIFHLNMTLFDSHLNPAQLFLVNYDAHSPQWRNLLVSALKK